MKTKRLDSTAMLFKATALAGAAAFTLCAAVLPATAAKLNWQILSGPRLPATTNSLLGVSCPASSTCIGVGDYVSDNGIYAALAEAWNGTSWTAQAAPSVPGATTNTLGAVACTSTTSCMAVGSASNASLQQPLAESWDGTAWKILATPRLSGFSSLSGIACAAAATCIAVGTSHSSASPYTVTLAEAWNGRSWSILTTPNPVGASDDGLNAVSCTSATVCTAVGSAIVSGKSSTLAESWNGTAWSIEATPNPSGSSASSLNGVSCASSTSCIAVGAQHITSEAALAESWDGTAWNIVPTPSPTGSTDSVLQGLSCISSFECAAVGDSITSSAGDTSTLAMSWNGAAWTVQPTPNATAAHSSSLSSVSCAAASTCLAVGSSNIAVTSAPAVAERWDGNAWTVTPTANVQGVASTALYAVSCPQTNECMAVGGGAQVLAEEWNGLAWSLTAPTEPSGSQALLQGVSCASASACIAVGSLFTSSSGSKQSLAESWDGTTWTVLPTPAPAGATLSQLLGVSCTSSSACIAVGSFSSTNGTATLAESWNGSAWIIEATPNPASAKFALLAGVSCTAGSACTAVGTSGLTSPQETTLAEAWNGSTWTIQQTPNPAGASHDVFSGISCASASACKAAGSTTDSTTNVTSVLVESWNGAGWSIDGTPNPSRATNSALSGISCASAVACTAVGRTFPDKGQGQVTLAESWGGTSWTILSTPSPGGASSQLSGASCASAVACIAVGNFDYLPNVQLTLIEQLS